MIFTICSCLHGTWLARYPLQRAARCSWNQYGPPVAQEPAGLHVRSLDAAAAEPAAAEAACGSAAAAAARHSSVPQRPFCRPHSGGWRSGAGRLAPMIVKFSSSALPNCSAVAPGLLRVLRSVQCGEQTCVWGTTDGHNWRSAVPCTGVHRRPRQLLVSSICLLLWTGSCGLTRERSPACTSSDAPFQLVPAANCTMRRSSADWC